MNNNYKIIRTIFENVFQRVLECKDNVTGEIFYNNVITSQKVIDLIDIDKLNSLNSNILDCYKTEDRIFIVTKSFDSVESETRSIKEYINTKKLSLKQQFYISKKIIELSKSIFGLTDVVQQKILDLNKVYVDNNDDVIVDCNLIFEQEYDIRDNETFKRMGNILHYIFSGAEIIDYNISEQVPPDMLKIIVRCLTKEYMYPEDALKELNNSPIYNMVYPNAIIESKVKEQEMKPVIQKLDKHKDVIKENIIASEKSNYDLEDEEKDGEDVLNIYLNDGKQENIENKNNEKEENKKNKDTKKGLLYYTSNKDVRRAAISLVIIISVLLIGNYLIKNFSKDAQDVSGKNTNVIQSNDNINNSNNQNNQDDNLTNENNSEGIDTDSISKFFNNELLNSIGYKGTTCEIDKDIYVEGNKSLVVKNDTDGKIKAIFAVIDFNDPDYSYMLKKQIAIAVKTKSENEVSALIVLEAFKDGKIASTFHTTTQIYNDMWSQNTVPINVTNADFLNIYIEYSGVNKVWLDSIYIDVVK